MAVAEEQEMKAKAQQARANVIQAEAEIPKAMAEAFILREGTDYGLTELDHAVKVKRLLELIEQGDVLITFDPATESFNIVKRKR